MTEEIEIGPVDYIVVEFPGNKMTGEGIPILRRPARERRHPHPRPRLRHQGRRRCGRRLGASPTSTGTGCSTSPCSSASPPGLLDDDDVAEAAASSSPTARPASSSSRTPGPHPLVGALDRGWRGARRERPHPGGRPAGGRRGRQTRATDSRAPEPPTRRSTSRTGKDRSPCQDSFAGSPARLPSSAPLLPSNGRVQRHQQQKFDAQDQAAYDAQQAQAAPPPQQYAPPPPSRQPPAARGRRGRPDRADDQRLGELNEQGLLTDEEFAVAEGQAARDLTAAAAQPGRCATHSSSAGQRAAHSAETIA